MADQGLSKLAQAVGSRAAFQMQERPSYSVRQSIGPTACAWGLSPAEVRRLYEAMHALRKTGWRHIYLVAGDGVLDLQECKAREVVRRLKSDIALYLKRAGRPVWYLEVIEATGGFHSNIVLPWYDGVERLRDSATYGFALKGEDAIQPVDDWQGLSSYLAGERNSRAQYAVGKLIGPRQVGAHYLETKQGGDRVRPSQALREHLIETGSISAWRRSYGKPLKPKASKEVAVSVDAPHGLEKTGQIQAIPMVSVIEEASGQLGFLLGEPIDLMAEAAKRRRERGLTQEEQACTMFIARPTLANCEAGRYRPSGWVLARAMDFLRAA